MNTTMKTPSALVAAALTLHVMSALTLSTPAMATDIGEVEKLCKARGSACSPSRNDDGSVIFGVDNSDGLRLVKCPKEGACSVIYSPQGGKGTAIGGLRAPVGGVTLRPPSSPPPPRMAGPVRVPPPVAISSRPTVGTIRIARAYHR